ncbi:UNVERIFIED_CONTAM: Transcriptional regulatory protein rxt3 [Sesamum indicum]
MMIETSSFRLVPTIYKLINEQSDQRFTCSHIPAANGAQMNSFFPFYYDHGAYLQDYELSQADKACEGSQNGPTLEICVPAEHVTATNRQVRGGQLWGTDVYTVDSDLVAVLMHTGYCRPTASPPPSATKELRATIRVLPPQDCYISTLRNNVRSRAWGAAIGCSYRVERCCVVKKGGGIIDLEPCLAHSSTMEPTLAPVAVERTMTTRAAASNALRQQRFVREVTIQFNLCMEPWLKYSISAVADKGLKKSLFTSARLKKGEVLYVETHSRSLPSSILQFLAFLIFVQLKPDPPNYTPQADHLNLCPNQSPASYQPATIPSPSLDLELDLILKCCTMIPRIKLRVKTETRQAYTAKPQAGVICFTRLLYDGVPCENLPTSANLKRAARTSVSASVNTKVGPLSPVKIALIAGGGECARKYLCDVVFAIFDARDGATTFANVFFGRYCVEIEVAGCCFCLTG